MTQFFDQRLRLLQILGVNPFSELIGELGQRVVFRKHPFVFLSIPFVCFLSRV
jgi:hypothetical protein